MALDFSTAVPGNGATLSNIIFKGWKIISNLGGSASLVQPGLICFGF